MPFAVINNIRMHFEVGGKGDPVLLINGLSAPAANWALQAKALAPHFTVVTFDNRGVGETDLPGEPVYSTGQLADDAAALLKHLKIARAHVVGASMGGTIAMEIAATTAARPLAVPRVHVGGGRRSLPAHARVVDIARLPCADRGALSAHALPLAVHARVWPIRIRPRPRPSIGRAGGSWPGTARGSRSSAVSACPRSCSSAGTTSSRHRPSRGRSPGPSDARASWSCPAATASSSSTPISSTAPCCAFLKSVRST